MEEMKENIKKIKEDLEKCIASMKNLESSFQEREEIELKICPFCGSKAVLHKQMNKCYYIKCLNNEPYCILANEFIGGFTDKEKCINLWNKRS